MTIERSLRLIAGTFILASLALGTGDIDCVYHFALEELIVAVAALNAVVASARQSNIAVMLSITHAPAWAMTPTGPEPTLTASLVISLAGVDLVYVGLNVVLTSVETALRHMRLEQLPDRVGRP